MGNNKNKDVVKFNVTIKKDDLNNIYRWVFEADELINKEKIMCNACHLKDMECYFCEYDDLCNFYGNTFELILDILKFDVYKDKKTS